MRVTDAEFVQGFIRLCSDGYAQGWHERNGGNLSYRIRESELSTLRPRLRTDGVWQSIGTAVPGLSGEAFLVSGSGKFMRNVALDPEACLAIIELDPAGENYRLLWGLRDGGKPTSELPTHLMNHEVKKRATNGRHRVIYHAHTPNLIALTFVLPLKDEVFTRELWEMATECPVVFPNGIGVVGWMVPGGREIAVETSRLMERYDAVVWAHHGLFCSGESFDLCFGLMHTIEKSAEILVKVLSVHSDRLQTIRPQDFRALAADFRLSLPERFLYEKESKCAERLAWRGRVKAGCMAEYRRRHAELWPEMAEVLWAAGIRNYSIFASGEELFGYYECERGVAYAEKVQAESPVVKRWNAYMQDILELRMDPETGAQPKLTQVFRLD